MSKFITSIPVDVAGVIAALPDKSFVHTVELKGVFNPIAERNGGDVRFVVEIVWDNDALRTAYTFPLEYPLEKLMPKKPVDRKAKKSDK